MASQAGPENLCLCRGLQLDNAELDQGAKTSITSRCPSLSRILSASGGSSFENFWDAASVKSIGKRME